MKKATAIAHSNIAFVKYWGKVNNDINLPANNSISMNLSEAKTTTTVEFDENLTSDEIFLLSPRTTKVSQQFSARVREHLDRIRSLAEITTRAKVITENTFPLNVGIASSASGIAALTLASAFALGLNLTEPELSALARIGSGSACRSIPGGFVEWLAGDSHETSYAVQIAPPEHWDVVDIAVAVSQQHKAIPSTKGHSLAFSSPFFQKRLESLQSRTSRIRAAIVERDFETLGQEVELEAISLHVIAMTSAHKFQGKWLSGIYYWSPETIELLNAVQTWRFDGIPVYFTLDAGPTVHLICPSDQRFHVVEAVNELEKKQPDRNWRIMINFPASGAYIL